MGNSPLGCFRGRGKVKLVLLNGDIAEFNEPVRASTVMKKYPQHIVLHCSMSSNRGTGQRRKIYVLGPDQALKRNEKYVLTPSQSAKNSISFLDSWAFFTISAAYNKKLNAKRRTSRPKTRWWTVFNKVCSTLRRPDEEEEKPLLQSHRPTARVDRPKLQPRKSGDGLRDWRPSLQRIPESLTVSPHLSRNSSFATYPRLDFR